MLLLVFMAAALVAGYEPCAETAIFAAIGGDLRHDALAADHASRRASTRACRRASAPSVSATWFPVSLPIFLVESFFFLLTNADVLMVGACMQPDDVAIYFATVKTLALVHFVYFAVKAGVAQRYAAFTHGDPGRLAAFARETVSWTFWPSL